NHTCEGNELGPTLSFRGVDNASYYRLLPDNPRYYINDTGCGNTLNTANPHVLRLILDSLRYWAEDMQVDGFRFDLATVLGREANGFDPNGGFFDAVRQDPVLSTRKLIAEPWDIGPGGYQLGHYPPPFAEWNDRFRDCVRRYWSGDRTVMRELADRLLGSSGNFDHGRRLPSASINFVTAHDGFTLTDLVSYHHKHNDANGEDNHDGHDANYSTNHGCEGPTDDPLILAARAQHRRNLLATVFLAQGTPMLLAGDEVGHSQSGNNNAYCQDNGVTWRNWDVEDGDMLAFTRRLIALRSAHPSLSQRRFLHGATRPDTALPDVSWFGPDGTAMAPDAWHEGVAVGMLLAGDGDTISDVRHATQPLMLLINGGAAETTWHLPPQTGRWLCVLHTDSAHWREPASAAVTDGAVVVPGQSVAVYRLHGDAGR
ncbi:MAG: glycogen debranching enzyme GlgX, partial [Pseudomonadota bacterium]